jgi:hypothetical protein
MDNKNLKGQVHNAMCQALRKKGWVAPVDVLLGMGVLTQADYENWRFGRVDFLERVCKANLTQLGRIMCEARLYAIQHSLKPSWTCYRQWGKQKERRLLFSKSGDEKIEHSYATHFVDAKRIAELKAQKEQQQSE